MNVSRWCLPIPLALLFLFVASRARSASPTLKLAEQNVIEALIPQDSRIGFSKKQVIHETTSVNTGDYDRFSEDLRRGAKDRDKPFAEALEDFLRKNRTAVRIVWPTNAPKSVELVSDSTVKEIFSAKHDAKPNGWELFYRRFPEAGGVVTISRVGIDSKGTVAIIYVGIASDYLAGSGSIRVLRPEGGKWVLKFEHVGPEWVS